ncbi:uncharacterized protein LOC107402114 isoform X2 [Peromyscus maniculatus bairdii]|uniref:uncharacterized protein LOC107402114 isoform X2 n=1 Tax=Peromyscus maniculatus bairdii TaxID=230844 RepID=UPI003FCFFA3C
MRRRRRLRWGAVGREAADQCGEEFTRGGACRGSPSSVESRAQRALCTPAAGARSRELGAHGRGDPVHTNPQTWGVQCSFKPNASPHPHCDIALDGDYTSSGRHRFGTTAPPGGSHSADQDGLELTEVHLLLPPKSWD